MKKIYADVQRLDLGELVDLFELDLTPFGGEHLRFHGYMQLEVITWQGHEYGPWPIQVDGIEASTEGAPAAPNLAVGNIGTGPDGEPLPGVISALCMQFKDLLGARVTMRRTLGRYLDAVNFPDGNPEADPTQELTPQVWEIELKSSEDSSIVTFELATVLDADGVQLPGMIIQTDVCRWTRTGLYRGPYCQYSGAAMFDENDNPTTDPALDYCPGLLSSCRRRLDANPSGFPGGFMNFLAFPAADRLRT
jgi:lambda family phage minor tail protein L